jgi:hypothetical protein
MAGVHSAPGAGVDVEAESGIIRNGVFEDCEFVDNYGCGFVADSGDSRDMQFKKCLFIGVSSWSNWTIKPKCRYYDCTFNGSIVHGCKATIAEDATQYYNCLFEDKMYNGKSVFGTFLVEVNQANKEVFDHCTFNAIYRKSLWIDGAAAWPKENFFIFTNNKVKMNMQDFGLGNYLLILRCAVVENNEFYYNCKSSKRTGYMEMEHSDVKKNNKSIFLPE